MVKLQGVEEIRHHRDPGALPGFLEHTRLVTIRQSEHFGIHPRNAVDRLERILEHAVNARRHLAETLLLYLLQAPRLEPRD